VNAPLPENLPPGAVLRVSRGRFDPARYEDVKAMIEETGAYLVPAIRALPGLIAYYAATTPDGITTQVSIWADAEAGKQMSTLPEMRDRARAAAEALGVVFDPIVQFPVNWSILPAR
jgi:quinol monooxygenase YgiN